MQLLADDSEVVAMMIHSCVNAKKATQVHPVTVATTAITVILRMVVGLADVTLTEVWVTNATKRLDNAPVFGE